MKGHAFFYFRDNAFIKDVPTWKQADVLAENVESARKLLALKQAISTSDPPVPCFDGYPCKYAGLKVNSRLLKLEVDDNDREAVEEVIKEAL